MIESIRKFLRSIFFKIIAVLLIASFAFWGIGDFSLNSISRNVVIEVGDLELESEDVADMIDQLITQQKLDALSKKELLKLGVSDSFLQTIINRKILEVEARDFNLVPNADLVRQSVFSNPNFAGDDKKFSLAKFDQYLANIGLNEQQLFDRLEASFMQSVLLDSLFLASNNNQYLAQDYYNYHNSSVDVSYFRIPIDASQVAYNDAELLDYYNNNINDYTSSGSKRLEFIILDSDQELKKQVINDDELNKFYSENIDKYSKPETRLLKWLFFDTENKASKNYQEIKQQLYLTGENVIVVDDAQSKFSIADKKLAQKIFEYDQIGLTEPIEGQYGWYIVEIVAINKAVIPSRQTVIKKMKQDLQRQKAYDSINQKLNSIENELSNNNNLASIQSSLGLGKIEVFDKLTLASKAEELKVELTELQKTDMLEKANRLEINDERFRTLEYINNSKDIKYVILYLSKNNPSEIHSFDSVYDKVSADYKSSIARKQTVKMAESYLSNFENNDGGYKLTRERNLSRAQPSNTLPDNVRNYILTTSSKNKASIYTTDDYSYVFKVQGSNRQDSKDADLSYYQQLALDDFQDGFFYYFTDYLTTQHKVTIEKEQYIELYQ